jgi:hypothetical protein
MGDRYRTSSARFGTRYVWEARPNQILNYLLYFVSHASPVSCFILHRNITIRTYPSMSSAMSAPCRKDISPILHAVTPACSSTCTLSSLTPSSAKSPCSGRTLI